jgi:redox-sensitive bicupin YhaK (pirin superfamily)
MIDLIPSRRESIGTFSVRRSLPTARRRMVGPFTFLDHMGPAAQGLDVAPHPHIGIATLTYLFEGEVVHHDSLGSTQPIRPGEANWMTAGRGIAHSERTGKPGPLHGIQAWLALPAEDEEVLPSFHHYEDLPTFDDDGVAGRLISGTAFGLVSPSRAFSPHFYVDVRLRAGASIDLPREHEERAAYIVSGSVSSYGEGNLLVGADSLTADTDATVMLLGGTPVGKRFMWWNFVSSRKERIEQAKADWAAGRIPLPPDDADESIPLPPDLRPQKPEPMS